MTEAAPAPKKKLNRVPVNTISAGTNSGAPKCPTYLNLMFATSSNFERALLTANVSALGSNQTSTTKSEFPTAWSLRYSPSTTVFWPKRRRLRRQRTMAASCLARAPRQPAPELTFTTK